MKIVKWLKRDPCKECVYYCSIHYNMFTNPVEWCQSKKVSNNGNGKITWVDKLFCSPYTSKKKKRDGGK